MSRRNHALEVADRPYWNAHGEFTTAQSLAYQLGDVFRDPSSQRALVRFLARRPWQLAVYYWRRLFGGLAP